MATQGATLERRGLHVPIWPIAVLVAIAVVTAITLITVRALNDSTRPARLGPGDRAGLPGRTPEPAGRHDGDGAPRASDECLVRRGP